MVRMIINPCSSRLGSWRCSTLLPVWTPRAKDSAGWLWNAARWNVGDWIWGRMIRGLSAAAGSAEASGA